METRIEDLLEEKHFTEEEIYENIKEIGRASCRERV